MNWYDSYDFQTCLNLFRINMIRIDAILKYVKKWRNTLKLSKWYMKCLHWRQSYSLDRFDERAVKDYKEKLQKYLWKNYEKIEKRISDNKTGISSWPWAQECWTLVFVLHNFYYSDFPLLSVQVYLNFSWKSNGT